MKIVKFSNWFLISIILAVMSVPASAEKVPEFGGGYIANMSGDFQEMKKKKASYTQISRGGMSVMALVKQPRTYYVADKSGMISVSSDSFKGIAIRGNYKFEQFSLHLKRKGVKVIEDGELYHGNVNVQIQPYQIQYFDKGDSNITTPVFTYLGVEPDDPRTYIALTQLEELIYKNLVSLDEEDSA